MPHRIAAQDADAQLRVQQHQVDRRLAGPAGLVVFRVERVEVSEEDVSRLAARLDPRVPEVGYALLDELAQPFHRVAGDDLVTTALFLGVEEVAAD